MEALDVEMSIAEGEQALQALITFAREHAGRLEAHEAEKGIFKRLLPIGLAAMKLYFAERGTGDVGPAIMRDDGEVLPMEQRLSALTERCAEILNRWSDNDQRHADAIKQLESKLNDWNAIEQRLEQDSLQRIREFEGTIEHEWSQLRQLHAEPVKQLREQTATLGETCVAAANLALRGFERAESRFAALEADLQERL